jgi:NTE family protein
MRIAVALSSGGAAGLAHIGVLEELTAAGVPVQCVAGTSAGAMVGAAFAAGDLSGFRERAIHWSRRRRMALCDPIWPRSGLLAGRRAKELLGACAAAAVESLPLAFAAVATDLDSGERILLRSGELWDAVRASIAVPGIFTPHVCAGRLLVDGALVDPIPVAAARELGGTFVIAVSVLGAEAAALLGPRRSTLAERMWARLFPRTSVPAAALAATAGPAADGAAPLGGTIGLSSILCRASVVVQSTIAAARLREAPPDFLIAPAAAAIGLFEVQRAAEAIELGRCAARTALPALRAAIDEARSGPKYGRRWWAADRAAA